MKGGEQGKHKKGKKSKCNEEELNINWLLLDEDFGG